MKRIAVLIGTVYLLGLSAGSALAETNWRRGDLYYKQVCNACHREVTGSPITPDSRTKAEWQAYIKAGKHSIQSETEGSLSFYTNKDYRESMEAEIPALVLFFDLQSDAILADIEAHLVLHAKDSDMPSNCQ